VTTDNQERGERLVTIVKEAIDMKHMEHMGLKKTIALAVVMACWGSIGYPCCSAPGGMAEKTTVTKDHLRTCRLSIKGMTCEGCAKGLQAALKKVQGVKHASVDFERKTATVEFTDPANLEQLKKTVARAGFQAEVAPPPQEKNVQAPPAQKQSAAQNPSGSSPSPKGGDEGKR